MFVAGIAALLVALTLMVVRALRGPTVFDRLVASNAVATAVILLLSLYGFFIDRPDFLDVALLYALLNAVGTFAVLKFWRHGWLGYTASDDETEEEAR